MTISVWKEYYLLMCDKCEIKYAFQQEVAKFWGSLFSEGWRAPGKEHLCHSCYFTSTGQTPPVVWKYPGGEEYLQTLLREVEAGAKAEYNKMVNRL